MHRIKYADHKAIWGNGNTITENKALAEKLRYFPGACSFVPNLELRENSQTPALQKMCLTCDSGADSSYKKQRAKLVTEIEKTGVTF